MTEKELIEIARRCAVNCSEHHSYMPSGPTSAACFWPHKWVLEAMAEAIKVAAPAAGASEGQAREEFFKGYAEEWQDTLKEQSDCIKSRDAEIAALRERITELETSEKYWISVSEGCRKLMNEHVVTLSERIAKYQAVCAAAYQFVGAIDGPVRFLDALSNAANGEPASVDASLALLPAEPSERIAGMEKDAERYRWLRDNGDLSVRDVFGSWCEQLNDGLDAAIDAAIAKEKQRD